MRKAIDTGKSRSACGRARIEWTVALLAVLSIGSAVARGQGAATAQPVPGIPWSEQKSGLEFLTPSTRARQNDLAQNPGMLWVDDGTQLWNKPVGQAGKSCASCHGAPASMKGVAARYPAWDAKAGRLHNLETRIQNCRVEHQKGEPLAAESEALLSLTAVVAYQSRGMPMSPSVEGPARAPFDQGRALYHARIGQLNLSCAQCHDQNWGRRYRAEVVSQGQSNGYPLYRLEWQTMGTLYRRIRGCFNSVRARPPEHGDREHLALELYLAWRAKGLPVESPAIRR
ncbi:MAG: sulfur oxidation c-type cytochrome SoxA [Hyphomicrobiaceae bacterium]